MNLRMIFVLSLCVLGCQGVEPIEKPEDVIPLDSLEQIIYDMTIVNAARGYNIQRFAQTGVRPETYIFEKYNIDSARYTKSTIYYSSDVAEYTALIKNIKARAEKEFKIADSLEKIDKKRRDSVRFANAKKRKQIKDNLQDNKEDSTKFPPTRIPQLDSILQK